MMLGLVGMIDHSVCEVEWRCDEAMNWRRYVFEFGMAIKSIETLDWRSFQFDKTI